MVVDKKEYKTDLIFEALSNRNDGYIYRICSLNDKNVEELLDWEVMGRDISYITWSKDKDNYHTGCIYRKQEDRPEHKPCYLCLGSDRLAYAAARLILGGKVPTRSELDDALLDYLKIGQPDGYSDVPTWMEEYERRRDEHN